MPPASTSAAAPAASSGLPLIFSQDPDVEFSQDLMPFTPITSRPLGQTGVVTAPEPQVAMSQQSFAPAPPMHAEFKAASAIQPASHLKSFASNLGSSSSRFIPAYPHASWSSGRQASAAATAQARSAAVLQQHPTHARDSWMGGSLQRYDPPPQPAVSYAPAQTHWQPAPLPQQQQQYPYPSQPQYSSQHPPHFASPHSVGSYPLYPPLPPQHHPPSVYPPSSFAAPAPCGDADAEDEEDKPVRSFLSVSELRQQSRASSFRSLPPSQPTRPNAVDVVDLTEEEDEPIRP